MESELPGVYNGHIVNDHLLRGGDLTEKGVISLANQGVVRIISLKNVHDDGMGLMTLERLWADGEGIETLSRPLTNSGKFSYDDIKLVPKILDSIVAPAGKVFVHCHHGSDRTGVVVACYRIQQEGWSAERAIEEMKKYGNAWYNVGMRRAVKEFGEHEQRP